MPLVVKSVSQGDELVASSSISSRWLIHYPLITASSKQRGDMERCCPYNEILIARLFDTLSIANQVAFIT